MNNMPDMVLKFPYRDTSLDVGFAAWKRLKPVQLMAHQLDFATSLNECEDWDDYTARFIAANDSGSGIVNAAQTLFGDLESEERPVLAAMLHAADFSGIADDLSESLTWWR